MRVDFQTKNSTKNVQQISQLSLHSMAMKEWFRDIFFSRHNHNLRVHGYREENEDITAFDMRVMSRWIASTWLKDAAKAAQCSSSWILC